MDMSKKVFVVQEHLVTDPQTGERVSKYNLDSAAMFGEVQYILDNDVKPWDDGLVEKVRQGLEEYEEGDYLVLMGNPMFIALTAVEAAQISNNLNFLTWSKITNAYTLYSIPIFDCD